MSEIGIKTDFPRKVREIENTWIPMPDGTRLAARIWLPEDAESDPVPAILEYLPYRKRDGTVERDHLTHPYFAGHGYAGVRVDMRGTGDSEGFCLGEYLLQEQDDALAVIDWLAAQPWCTGKVGMMGISWGGFNGLQVAARQPSALGAVITLCSTDDRYADDIHFMGGAMLTEKVSWGATAFAISNTPPDPAIVGDRWRKMWAERLGANGLWLVDWLRHQRRDDFYAHGSICEDYGAVKVPVYAVGGYSDGYTNPIFRMMEHLSCPRKALVGPWAHKYPHFAKPEPRIGFLQEALRWWDQHLKGIDTGVMDEPMIRAWMQEPAPPSPHAIPKPGRWISAEGWPAARTETKRLHVTPNGLQSDPVGDSEAIDLSNPETAGWTAQSWFTYGVVPDSALDQNGERGLMEFFETPPLENGIEIFGFPQLRARVTSDTPQANLSAVLSIVAPDGAATLISYGVLNLSHRDRSTTPETMPVGVPVDVTLQLNAIGQAVPPGYRLRLALSTSYWPLIWPAPARSRLSLTAGEAVLELPLMPGTNDEPGLPEFGPPEGASPLEAEVLSPPSYRRLREIDVVSGIETCSRETDAGTARHLQTGLVVGAWSKDSFSIHPMDPTSAEATCSWRKSYARGDWKAELETAITVRALAEHWHLTAHLKASDADGVVGERSWDERIPRDMV